MSKKGGFSLLLGAVVGVLTALFFAPVKGKEIRKKVKDEVNKGGIGIQALTTELKDMYTDMKQSFDKWLNTEDVKEVIKKGKKAIDQAKIKGQEVIENIAHEMDMTPSKVLKTKKKAVKTKAKVFTQKKVRQNSPAKVAKTPVQKKAKAVSKTKK